MPLASWLRHARDEALLVAALLVVSLTIWSFAELADEVIEGETHAFDRTVLLAMREPGDGSDPIGPPSFEEMVRDLSALGGTVVLTLVTVASVLYLWLASRRGVALSVAVAVGSGVALTMGLKEVIDRPRPELVPHGAYVISPSFPSGHSMMAAIVYLTVGILLAGVQPRRRLKLYVLGMSILVTVLVGLSRIYLGVHWPTDVLAGWSGGAAWAVLCWLVAVWLRRRGHLSGRPLTGPR
ncbi:MAG: phosphatase PAP2 family protein [Candidatus Eiseniibacteriota bacterium]